MKYQFKKHFTLAEARAMLPKLRRLFAEFHVHRERAQEADNKLGRSLAKTGGDLGGELVAGLTKDLVMLNAEIRKFQAGGVVIKDFDRGLVDFPSLKEGREIFLCWELEEDDIEFFHDIEDGYAGRERL